MHFSARYTIGYGSLVRAASGRIEGFLGKLVTSQFVPVSLDRRGREAPRGQLEDNCWFRYLGAYLRGDTKHMVYPQRPIAT